MENVIFDFEERKKDVQMWKLFAKVKVGNEIAKM